ncbi:MAG: UDP-N-acetylmuramoylalanyl-D-glutamyl-2,6-diaminopimelate--D-alanyl-D-alanine ligase [Rhizobiaceae bacterium]
MSFLWTTSDMIAAMNGRPVGDMPEGVTGISIDSRSVDKGNAFFAIKGDSFDGHDFAGLAMASGASLIVVAESKLPALGRLTVPMIVVPDVLKGLEQLGAASRARSHAQIIAVTGSAGKTTTKEALRHVLSACGKVHASAASFNNHWGVPLTLARMPQDTDYGVFEIGMNHPGEIRPLVKLVRPHVAIITIIAAAHLGHFKNLDEIALAKAEIFEGVVEDGYVVLNRDDQRYRILELKAKSMGLKNIYGFGEHVRSKFKLVKYKPLADCSVITARINGIDVAAKIGSPGRHIVQNALAVMGACWLAGADLARVAMALASLEPEKGRGRRHRLKVGGGTFTLIDESYNANPASMAAALQLAASIPTEGRGRHIAVLGDMLELGRHARKLHAELAAPLAANKIGKVFLGGPEMQALAEALPADMEREYCLGVDELKPVVTKAIRPGDVVVVKSSNGIGFSRLVEHLLKQFPPSKAAVEPA